MTSNLNGGSWFAADDGCTIRCFASGRDAAHLIVGDTPHVYELGFDFKTLRDVVTKTTAVLAEMETRPEDPDPGL